MVGYPDWNSRTVVVVLWWIKHGGKISLEMLGNDLVEYFMFKLWCSELPLFQWTFRGQYMDSELKMPVFLPHISVNSPGSLRADVARAPSFLPLLPSSELTILNMEISRPWTPPHWVPMMLAMLEALLYDLCLLPSGLVLNSSCKMDWILMNFPVEADQ